ncbi:unnamed protein product [Prunus brigantina]
MAMWTRQGSRKTPIPCSSKRCILLHYGSLTPQRIEPRRRRRVQRHLRHQILMHYGGKMREILRMNKKDG